LLIVDEPQQLEQETSVIGWAEAIKKAGSKLTIWENPARSYPNEAASKVLLLSDIVCINRQLWFQNRIQFDDFFVTQKARNKRIELYSCSYASQVADPSNYFRLQAWDCWQIGSDGMNYWSFSDTGGRSSWNEYAMFGVNYSPLMIDEHNIYCSKQMEAIREGVEDYEYLAMLDSANYEKHHIGSNKERERRQLLDAVNAFISSSRMPREMQWNEKGNDLDVDAFRKRILILLVDLSAAG
jgi:hypothetical protein